VWDTGNDARVKKYLNVGHFVSIFVSESKFGPTQYGAEVRQFNLYADLFECLANGRFLWRLVRLDRATKQPHGPSTSFRTSKTLFCASHGKTLAPGMRRSSFPTAARIPAKYGEMP